jgi:uncharacterized protein with PIN domain
VKILLDENFPLQLYRRLRLSGYDVEHIIVLGQRGMPDSAIQERILKEDIIFLTQDSEFGSMPACHRGVILISRIKQSIPIQKRTETWLCAIERFMAARPAGNAFEVLETGEVAELKGSESE